MADDDNKTPDNPENAPEEPQNAAGGQSEPEPEETPEEDVKDKHGQPGINKERHDKEVAALNKQIEELKAQVEESAKTEEARQSMAQQIEELKAQLDDSEVTHRLEMAGCRSVKAAKALLEDYQGDVGKLKEAEPWLFTPDEPKKGKTGLPPAGAASNEEDEQLAAYKALGVKPPKKKE